jgi:hypothetical protein
VASASSARQASCSAYPVESTTSLEEAMGIVFAIIGFVGGAVIGIAVFELVISGERRVAYQLMATRHAWIRLVSTLWSAACGAVLAFFA